MADAWVWSIRRDVGPNFQITKKTAESARDTLKTVITKQPLLERQKRIMTSFRLFLCGRKARPRNERRPIRMKPAKSLQNARKRKVTKN